MWSSNNTSIVVTFTLNFQNMVHSNMVHCIAYCRLEYIHCFASNPFTTAGNDYRQTHRAPCNASLTVGDHWEHYSHNLTCNRCGSRGGRGPGPPLDPRFWGPKIEHFWALFNFSLIFLASLRSAYYFFNMLLFQSSNSKIFKPRFARHMISHLEVFVLSLSFTHFGY